MAPDATSAAARPRTVPAAVRAQVDALFTTRRRARLDHRVTGLRAIVGLLLVAASIGLVVASTETAWAHGLDGGRLHAWGVASHALVTGAMVIAIAMVRAWSRADAVVLGAVAVAGLGGSALLVQGERPMVAVAAALVGATAAGFLVAGSIARVTWLVPLAIAGSISDARSVAHGTTHALLEAATVRDNADAAGVAGVRLLDVPAARLDLLVFHLPSISGPWVLGIIDVVVVAMFVASTVHFRLPVPRTVVAMVVALTLAAIPSSGVAVIPILSLAFVVAHAHSLLVAGRYAWRRALVHAGLRS